MTANNDPFKLGKTAFSTASLFEESDEKAYWLSKTPPERWQAIEVSRQIAYGYDPAATRLQRVLEVVDMVYNDSSPTTRRA